MLTVLFRKDAKISSSKNNDFDIEDKERNGAPKKFEDE